MPSPQARRNRPVHRLKAGALVELDPALDHQAGTIRLAKIHCPMSSVQSADDFSEALKDLLASTVTTGWRMRSSSSVCTPGTG